MGAPAEGGDGVLDRRIGRDHQHERLGPGAEQSVEQVEPVEAGELDVAERQVGLEWKLADFFHDKTVVLIVEPHEPDPQARIAELEATIDRIRGEVER